MKQLFCAILFAVMLAIRGQAGELPEPRAVFEKITVDFKAAQEGENGMMLHLWFTVHDMKDSAATLAIYFQHNDYHRGYVKDTNRRYYSSGGEVAVYKDIKPRTAAEAYEDIQVFMPYGELDLYPGDYPLTMDIKLIRMQGGLISALTKYDFNYTKPLANTSFVPSASIDSIVVEHNITENNSLGMRIKPTKLSVNGMKNTECYLAIYFEKSDRTQLKTNNTQYRAQTGQTAVFKLLAPAYDAALYEDLALFIPYEAFGLDKGKHDLQMDIDVIYKNGYLLKHMRFQAFKVEL